MELFTKDDIISILNQCGVAKPQNLKWTIKSYSEKLIGYLGEHLSLNVNFDINEDAGEMVFFIKCIPRFNEWKANYLRETDFFNKEYAMLNGVFKNFEDTNGLRKWRPKLLYIKEELFVFEDVTQIGYLMPSRDILTHEELIATVSALARFHAQSFIYEDRKSRELNRRYEIWEDYSQYLYEPPKGKSWRETGMRAAIDFLKAFSRYKLQPNFDDLVEKALPKLFISADKLMKPSEEFKNVIIHRDIWFNNIFLKKMEDGKMHALIVDYQTVLYCPPMLDLSSLLYFNTTKTFRHRYTRKIIEHYYDILSQELKLGNINIDSIIDLKTLEESYQKSLVFGIAQGVLIVPIATMTDDKKKAVFDNPKIMYKINCISRSQEFIELATENEEYRERVLDLLDEVVERFIYLSESEKDLI